MRQRSVSERGEITSVLASCHQRYNGCSHGRVDNYNYDVGHHVAEERSKERDKGVYLAC